MEQVLDVYQSPYDPKNPWVCFDESCKQLVKETRDPIPAEPGQKMRYDYRLRTKWSSQFVYVFRAINRLETYRSD